MTVDPYVQAEFERNQTWERSWPKCFFAVIAVVEILLALLLLVTEAFNILMDVWHANVFGGIWAGIILFINWILIFVTVCCATTVTASTCSLVWNCITLIAVGTLIVFDVLFILDPTMCLLTPTCASQAQVFSYNNIVQTITQFQSYTIYDSKKLFLQIQVGCAGLAFLISLIYIIIFLICRFKLRERAIIDNPNTAMLPRRHGLRVSRPPYVNPTDMNTPESN